MVSTYLFKSSFGQA